ncbi:hypothetical protein HDV02_000171 [Globomyces sp. JEL0801]|nr:hypothetical protein HDV02_000171 [Globomyces sp. JEL0801]
MTIYETGLRQFCNYNEGIPYFDYSLDSQAPDKSPIWDWFGKNGDPKTKCITGNLQGLMGNYLPDPKVASCVKRDWLMASKAEGGPLLGAFYSPQQISTILKNKNYNSFRIALENGPHNNFHMAIGGISIVNELMIGDMYDPDTSPNDPIFFMHHANIDRLWAVWQSQNPSVAFTYFGNTNRDSDVQDAKTSDIMYFHGMIADKTVGSAIDLSSRCIEYSNSVTPELNQNLLKKRDLQIQVPELYNTTTPDSHDRQDLFNLRYVSPLSIEFLKKFRYSDKRIMEIKLQESQLRVYTDFLNSLPLDYSGSLADFIDGQENGWRSKTDMEMQGDLRLYMALTDAVPVF